MGRGLCKIAITQGQANNIVFLPPLISHDVVKEVQSSLSFNALVISRYKITLDLEIGICSSKNLGAIGKACDVNRR